MRATAQFQDPTDSAVTITLSGTLGEFEKLSEHLTATVPVPFWAVSALVTQIREAAWALRSKVTVEEPEQPE